MQNCVLSHLLSMWEVLVFYNAIPMHRHPTTLETLAAFGNASRNNRDAGHYSLTGGISAQTASRSAIRMFSA